MRAGHAPQQRIRHFAKLRLLATILGCRFDDLRQREQERQRRRLLLLTGLISVALVVVGYMGWLANERRKEAQLQRDIARAELLAIQARRAEAQVYSSDIIERGGALAVEAMEMAAKAKRPVEADATEAAASALAGLPLMELTHGGRSCRWRCWRTGGWRAAAKTARSSCGRRTPRASRWC